MNSCIVHALLLPPAFGPKHIIAVTGFNNAHKTGRPADNFMAAIFLPR